MKQIFFISTIILLLSCGANTTDNTKSALTSNDTLMPFNIVLYKGDIANLKYEINIYIKDNKYFADNLAPYFYIGKQTDSIWTVELDQFQILNCKKFLSKARSLPKECPQLSTSIEKYIITIGYDTIKINGECEWDSLGFFELRQLLFKNKFEELELAKSNLIKDLNKKIIGEWYFKPLKAEPNNGDYIILNKTNDFNSDCRWIFGKDNSFNSISNKILKLTYSDKYEWNVDGDIYFIIQAGIPDKNGSMTIGNSETGFTLESLTENELKFKVLWR